MVVGDRKWLSAQEGVIWQGPSPGSSSSSWGLGLGRGLRCPQGPSSLLAPVGQLHPLASAESSSRLEASTGAGVPGSGLWSRCGAVGACLGGPALGSLCACSARPSTVTCPALGPWPSHYSSSWGVGATSAPGRLSCSCRGLPSVCWILKEPRPPGNFLQHLETFQGSRLGSCSWSSG